jgi:hypothetical protein
MDYTMNQIRPALEFHIRTQQAFLLISAPGLGKTTMVGQVCEDIPMPLITVTPALDDPTRYGGLYFVSDGKAQIIPLSDLQSILNASQPICVFMDDLGQASEAVQKSLMPWLWGDTIQGNKINRSLISIAAATNDQGQHSGVSGLIEPVKSRIMYHYSIRFDLTSWVEYALAENFPAELIAFAKFQHDLFDFTPSKKIQVSITPRTYSELCRVYPNIPAPIREMVIYGNLGEIQGKNLLSFLPLMSKLPNIGDILAGKPVSTNHELSILNVVILTLLKKMNAGNIDNIGNWISGLSGEMQGFFWSMAAKSQNALCNNCRFFQEFRINNQGFII